MRDWGTPHKTIDTLANSTPRHHDGFAAPVHTYRTAFVHNHNVCFVIDVCTTRALMFWFAKCTSTTIAYGAGWRGAGADGRRLHTFGFRVV